MVEARRHHARDGVEIAIEANLCAQHFRIGAERAAPVSVADDHRFRESRQRVGGNVSAAQFRVYAQHREVVRVGYEGFHALRMIAAGDVGVSGESRANILEHAGLVAQIPKLRDGHLNVVRVRRPQVVIHAHELLRMRKRKRLEKHGVDNSENGDVGADPQSQRENCHEREAGRAPKHARGVAQILTCGFDPSDDVHGASVLLQQSGIFQSAVRRSELPRVTFRQRGCPARAFRGERAIRPPRPARDDGSSAAP